MISKFISGRKIPCSTPLLKYFKIAESYFSVLHAYSQTPWDIYADPERTEDSGYRVLTTFFYKSKDYLQDIFSPGGNLNHCFVHLLLLHTQSFKKRFSLSRNSSYKVRLEMERERAMSSMRTHRIPNFVKASIAVSTICSFSFTLSFLFRLNVSIPAING